MSKKREKPLEIDIYYQREIQTLFTFFIMKAKIRLLFFSFSIFYASVSQTFWGLGAPNNKIKVNIPNLEE